VVLGRGVGVEPPIADLHDGSVADSAAFVHANSIGATGWCRPAERVGPGPPGTYTFRKVGCPKIEGGRTVGGAS
jgi:hypothetical protein